LQQFRLNFQRWLPNLAPAALPALGPAIFGWHLDRVGWKWRSFIDVQSEWFRTSAMPWKTFQCAVQGCELKLTVYGQTRMQPVNGADWGWLGKFFHDPSWSLLTSEAFRKRVADSDTLELVCTVAFLALAVIGLKKLPLYQSAFLWPGLVIPLFSPSTVHPLMSMPRFGLTLFPLFVVLALLFRGRDALPMGVLSAMFLVALTVQFANWYWVS
jgi:hypothetical protein